jgi:hypothetical protein
LRAGELRGGESGNERGATNENRSLPDGHASLARLFYRDFASL